jgi:hypothetical protein
MIIRPDLQCESPYFHGLWYFYLSLPVGWQVPRGFNWGLEQRVICFNVL